MDSMRELPCPSPFGAPVLYVPVTTSTMDDARDLARRGYPHGTVIAAGFQSAGRGRFRDRVWLGEPGRDLLCTLILDGALLPLAGFPLKVGLGLCRAVEALDQAPGAAEGEGAPAPRIKWPNDLLIGGKKAAGILCEGSGGRLYAGIGVNCRRRPFPEGLRVPPTSMEEALGLGMDPLDFLPLLLEGLHSALSDARWREETEARLYCRGEVLSFREADPLSGALLRGRIAGLGSSGELLLALEDGSLRACASGEIEMGGE